jgi:hypothetical protein
MAAASIYAELAGGYSPAKEFVMRAEHLWVRYLPGAVAALGSLALIGAAPKHRKMLLTGIATLLGLVCMEAEYWVAHGFPASEASFFSVAVVVTLAALFAGGCGSLLLSVAGFAFFAYVNLRYGAPYLLDYVMPVLYAFLMARSRRALNWSGRGILAIGRLEGALLIPVLALIVLRTTTLAKWGWISGKPW